MARSGQQRQRLVGRGIDLRALNRAGSLPPPAAAVEDTDPVEATTQFGFAPVPASDPSGTLDEIGRQMAINAVIANQDALNQIDGKIQAINDEITSKLAGLSANGAAPVMSAKEREVAVIDALKRYGRHPVFDCYYARGGDSCDCGLDGYTSGQQALPASAEACADSLMKMGTHRECGYTLFGGDSCDCGFYDAVSAIDPTLDPYHRTRRAIR